MAEEFDETGASTTMPSKNDGEETRATGPGRDEFLTMLSHELRTPLNGIMGMLQLALHATNRNSITEYLTVALESGKQMHLLLSGISEIVGGRASDHQAKQEYFDLESLIAPAISSFTANAGAKGLSLCCRIDPKLPKHLWGNSEQIRQILCNLLASAIRHAAQGSINVEIDWLPEHDPMKRHGLFMQIKVTDDDADNRPASSRKTDSDVSRADAGMGLEYAIAEHLVKNLDGEITLSRPQGMFSAVQATLPLQIGPKMQQEEPAEKKEEEASHRFGAPRILVVEDDPINLKTMLLSLHLLSCTAVGANSAYKALSILRKAKFDAMIMDIQMPGMDGLEATRLIRGDTSGSLDANIPIVAITAQTLQGDRERILKAGINEYLAKPVYLEQLRNVLSKLLNRPLEFKDE
ncbi:MAG: response regulator [Deltaproteobacteria bacterium]|jgi:CheY-like chemotaxis protein|nr:response regulator [Deltaproteobacteria bacterium]